MKLKFNIFELNLRISIQPESPHYKMSKAFGFPKTSRKRSQNKNVR